MQVYHAILRGEAKLAVVGLGYVGFPMAVAFAHKVPVLGFDLDETKLESYRAGVDVTREVGNEELKAVCIEYSSDPEALRQASFFIVAVPTPINQDKTPDLALLKCAARLIGENMPRGSVVVFESTVYPGVTEDICIPVLEQASGMICGKDFKVGYSPERINPGDKQHRFNNITKIISGIDDETIDEIRSIYELVIDAGTYVVSSIKTAEAIKVAENSQRDINIAFMNELAMVFDRMGIDTNEVVDGMNTKWNALGFRPGLVGGHCIGVDPYYFVYEAESLGYHSQIILSGRKVNDGMGAFVAEATVREMVLTGGIVYGAKVALLGISFKENCADIRNSKVVDIIDKLREYGVEVRVADPWADPDMVKKHYGISLCRMDEIRDANCVIVAVAHDDFRRLADGELDSMFCKDIPAQKRVLVDVKGIFNFRRIEKLGYRYWRL